MSERDVDAEFDAIVSRWADASTDPPDAEQIPHKSADGPIRTVYDITATYAAMQREESAPSNASANESPNASTDDGVTSENRLGDMEPAAWRDGGSGVVEEEHFEPPPVSLPPGEDLGYWAVVIGMLGGPVLMMWAGLARPAYATWWMAAGLAATLGGFALLIMRSPQDRGGDDGDDGARL